MPSDDRSGRGWPVGDAVHATAVAIGSRGLLIRGPSGSGKSRLAFALIAATTRGNPIQLVGDDRILLTQSEAGLIARPHPRIAGFIERRGLGIVATRFIDSIPIGGVVLLGPESSSLAVVQNFPCLSYVSCPVIDADTVLRWWRGARTTPAANLTVPLSAFAKD
jgi:hypothetical protein